MRPNKRVEMTDRGLHEAMGTRQFHEIDPVNMVSWAVIAILVGAFWGWLWFVLGTIR